ncbi:glycosyltransferase [Candidatus Dependentiae bacterium]|nr:glycosyltransferase [Candidatus Dependentiae bacterium]
MRIIIFNPQGNFDKNDSHITEHPDFGGQLVYVKQLALALSDLGHNIDIFTRKIVDPEWPEFSSDIEFYRDNDKVKIIRLPFSTLKFLPKEEIWPYLCSEYIPLILEYYKKNNLFPDVGSSHYADGGFAAAYFKKLTGIKYTFTGHSLGAQKMDKFNVSPENIIDYEHKYKFSKRVIAERVSIKNASIIVASSENERFVQYAHKIYKNVADVNNDNKFKVIAPGISLPVFDKNNKEFNETEIINHINRAVCRDIDENRRTLPYLIVSARIDHKKNHIGLLNMFSEVAELQKKCNLMFITRNHNNPLRDYKKLTQGFEQEIIWKMVEIISKNKLIGKITMFSLSGQNELAVAYRYLSRFNSLFVLPALFEPFGLAPIEAMASGLPVVVTKFGGTSESLFNNNIEYGKLIDPNNFEEFSSAVLELIKNKNLWNEFSEKGYEYVSKKFDWEIPSLKYQKVFEKILSEKEYSSISDISEKEFEIINDEHDIKKKIEVINQHYF